MKFKNTKDCHLMIWETVPAKRNINNEIKFNINKNQQVKEGDEIICYNDKDTESCYTIKEILNVKDSSIDNMNYITAKTEWSIKSIK